MNGKSKANETGVEAGGGILEKQGKTPKAGKGSLLRGEGKEGPPRWADVVHSLGLPEQSAKKEGLLTWEIADD